MAASANITVTAPKGPGGTVTSQLFSAAIGLEYDFKAEIFRLTQSDGVVTEFDFETIATITHTISGEVSTIAITT